MPIPPKPREEKSVLPNTKGTDDLGFAGLDIVLGHAQAVFLVERENELGELSVLNPGLHLAVEQVAGRLSKWCFVDGINGLMERFDVE